MTVNKINLSNFKFKFGLYALVAFGLYSNIYDFFYLKEMYSCTKGFNLCLNTIFEGFLSSNLMIYTLQLLKIFSFIGILYPKYFKLSIFTALITGVYFVLLNNYIYSPDIPYIHFLLLTLLFTGTKKEFFKDVYGPFMAVVYISYSFSGFYKLMTPMWINGQFLDRFFKYNHLAYPWIGQIKINSHLLYYLTFYILFMEALAALSIFNRYIRSIIWFNLTLTHVSLLFIADLKQVSLAMIVIHIFLIDQNTWNIICEICGPKKWSGVDQPVADLRTQSLNCPVDN